MHDYSRQGGESALHRGTPGYMSPRVAQGALHGLETDYYSFGCLLLTTTEPAFEHVLSRIYAQEYPDEGKGTGKGKGTGAAILKDRAADQYLTAMLQAGKNDPNSEVRGRDL